MKVLYISEGGQTCDYMRDMLFHGLRTLLGADVVDVHKIDTMYQGYPTETCYGKGFSIYGLLPDIPVDRDNITQRISKHDFGLVIYGSIHRNRAYLAEVGAHYRLSEIIAIDGEDHADHPYPCRFLTFKRELEQPREGFLPIQFAIPKQKILPNRPGKHHWMAPMDPLHKETYIYETEAEYYRQYAESYFAPTMKKGGWDCMRHYEILANWCIPYFRVMDQLPSLICHNLPKAELMLVKNVIEYEASTKTHMHDVLLGLYDNLIRTIMEVVSTKLTTSALGEYVLNKIGIV